MSHHTRILAPAAGATPQACVQQGSKEVKALSLSLVSSVSIAERFVHRNAIGSSINA